MTFRKLLMLGGAVAVMMTGASQMANAAVDDDISAQAVIVATLTIDCSTQDLDFGTIDPGTTGGTVTMSTAGTRSVTGDSAAMGVTESEGQCTVGGEDTYPYDITITGPGNLQNLALDNLPIGTFVVAVDAGADQTGPYSGTMSGATDILHVGATISPAAGQAVGTYTGVVNVEVAYQ